MSARVTERSVVENTLNAFVWKSAEATVFPSGGQAPFCASEARQVVGACVISDEAIMPKNPKRDSERKPTSMSIETDFMMLILA